MSFLNNLPPLVAEMIFSHLNKEDFLESTLISPQINETISNSLRLMRKYRFRLGPPTSATRKYSKIDFFYFRKTAISVDLPTYLTEATFDSCVMEAKTFHELLLRMS